MVEAAAAKGAAASHLDIAMEPDTPDSSVLELDTVQDNNDPAKTTAAVSVKGDAGAASPTVESKDPDAAATDKVGDFAFTSATHSLVPVEEYNDAATETKKSSDVDVTKVDDDGDEEMTTHDGDGENEVG